MKMLEVATRNGTWPKYLYGGFSRNQWRQGFRLREVRYRMNRIRSPRYMTPLSNAWADFESGFILDSIGPSCKQAPIRRRWMTQCVFDC